MALLSEGQFDVRTVLMGINTVFVKRSYCIVCAHATDGICLLPKASLLQRGVQRWSYDTPQKALYLY